MASVVAMNSGGSNPQEIQQGARASQAVTMHQHGTATGQAFGSTSQYQNFAGGNANSAALSTPSHRTHTSPNNFASEYVYNTPAPPGFTNGYGNHTATGTPNTSYHNNNSAERETPNSRHAMMNSLTAQTFDFEPTPIEEMTGRNISYNPNAVQGYPQQPQHNQWYQR